MIAEDLANLKNPTTQERAVIKFVLLHPEYVETHTAKELAQATFTSSATVTRLCQRVGCGGYGEFRTKFTAEWKASSGNLYARLSKPLVSRDSSPAEVAELMPKFYNRVVYETNRLLDPKKFEELCSRVLEVRAVDFYGNGINFSLGQEAAFKLQTLGLSAHTYNVANVQAIKRRPEDEPRLSIIISHTGTNQTMLEAAALLAENGCYTVAITPSDKSRLAQMCDLSLRMFTTSTYDRLSLLSYPISTKYLFDCLYAALFSRSIDDVYQLTANEFYKPDEDA